jgi:antitoxin component YwqK of YwqJK toxin-antitoxin module
MIKPFSIATISLMAVLGSAAQQHPAETSEVHHVPATVTITSPFSPSKYSWELPRKGKLLSHYSDQKMYEGSVKDYRLHGTWQSWYVNGQRLDSGKLVKGVPDGEWKHWDSSGQLLYTRHYNADKLQRVKNEMRLNHPKSYFFALTSLYKKDSRAAVRYLNAGYSFPLVSPARAAYSLQQLTEMNNHSKGYRPVFSECLHHGLYMNFFTTGVTKDSGYYKDGLREGIWLHREKADGGWWQGAYKNGMCQHEWKQYDSRGRLVQIVFYNKNGEETGRRSLK